MCSHNRRHDAADMPAPEPALSEWGFALDGVAFAHLNLCLDACLAALVARWEPYAAPGAGRSHRHIRPHVPEA